MIGTKKLLELVNNPKVKLVENLCERELTNPEGAGFDLRLGEVYKFLDDDNRAYLGIDERYTPDTKLIASFGRDKKIVVMQGDYYLVKTIERVNLPRDIVGIFRPRTTLQRSGLGLITGAVSPGYRGELTFGLYNPGSNRVEIEMGARIVHMLFDKTSKNVSAYRGQWQGGKVSTNSKKEKQV